jgi:hypothetical protein
MGMNRQPSSTLPTDRQAAGGSPIFKVKLCNDLTGWFASLSDDVAEYPGVTVHSEQGFSTSDEALRALDLTQVLAQRLGGDSGAATGVPPQPRRAYGREGANAPAFVGQRAVQAR